MGFRMASVVFEELASFFSVKAEEEEEEAAEEEPEAEPSDEEVVEEEAAEEEAAEEEAAEGEEEEEEDEEDLIDPAEEIKEKCATDHCSSYKAKLDECEERVRSKTKTTETCFEEILDFYHCVDHCAASQIFKYVK